MREQALESEDLLKRAIGKFSRYVAPVEGEVVAERPPVFDALIFAGGAEFALRTAPVLAYYDLGSDAVMYLGNAQWNQRQILSEPSLQKGLFAFRPSNTDDQFVAKWTAVWPDRPGLLSRLSFDAVALAEVLAGKDRSKWQKELLSSVGFNGFSGLSASCREVAMCGPLNCARSPMVRVNCCNPPPTRFSAYLVMLASRLFKRRRPSAVVARRSPF